MNRAVDEKENIFMESERVQDIDKKKALYAYYSNEEMSSEEELCQKDRLEALLEKIKAKGIEVAVA